MPGINQGKLRKFPLKNSKIENNITKFKCTSPNLWEIYFEIKKAVAQKIDKNIGKIIIATGIKIKKIPDFIKKELPIQYSPERNQPKLKENPNRKVCQSFVVSKTKKIAAEKQIIKG